MIPKLNRILVFRIGHRGDTIVTLPAFWSIREAFPHAHIALLSTAHEANPEFVAARNVLPENGLFDDWIVYSHRRGKLKAAVDFAGLLMTLRKHKFDAVFYLMTRNRAAASIKRDRAIFRAAGIKKVYGDSFLAKNLIGPQVRPPLPELDRESDFFLRLLRDLGIQPSKRGAEMLISESEAGRAHAWLSQNLSPEDRNKRLLALAPGSKWESKVWSEDKFIRVTAALIERFDVFPLIFGAAEDREKGQRIISALGRGANAAGELSVREGTAAMKEFELYLGNDTGTMHMAAAAGVPCVAVFAALDFPGRWYPFGDNNRVFRVAVECEGCHTPDCFNAHKCLESVESDAVLEACSELLAG